MTRPSPRGRLPRPALIGLLVCLPLGLQCHDEPAVTDWQRATQAVRPSGIFENSEDSDEPITKAAEKPLEFLRYCRRRYDDHVKDYRCRFSKQENLATGLTAEQAIEIRFRNQPFSVDVQWVKNAGRARQVSYVADRWTQNGQQLARINPSGVAGLLVPGGVRKDIHGTEVRAASRRAIDQFGFAKALDLIIKYCVRAHDDPAFGLKYSGNAYVDGRPCLVLERRLPYKPGDPQYPDKVLDIYIDRGWLVPTGCIAYADAQ